MIRLDVKVDISGAIRKLGAQQRQLPFAVAKALTATAKDAQRAVTAELPRVFDRPNPFTMRAIAIRSANKQNQKAVVYVREKQAQYLQLEVEGGVRRPRGRALALPSAVPRDAYGNVGRTTARRLRARKDVFSGTVGGIGGVWQRTPGRLVLLLAYESTARYTKRLPFVEIVQKTVDTRWPANLRASVDYAVRTARR